MNEHYIVTVTTDVKEVDPKSGKVKFVTGQVNAIAECSHEINARRICSTMNTIINALKGKLGP